MEIEEQSEHEQPGLASNKGSGHTESSPNIVVDAAHVKQNNKNNIATMCKNP